MPDCGIRVFQHVERTDDFLMPYRKAATLEGAPGGRRRGKALSVIRDETEGTIVTASERAKKGTSRWLENEGACSLTSLCGLVIRTLGQK